jgi:hypothetical protein
MVWLKWSEHRVKPGHRLVPHCIEELVEQDRPGYQKYDGAVSEPPYKEGKCSDNHNCEQCMEVDPAGAKRLREENKTKRFIDDI